MKELKNDFKGLGQIKGYSFQEEKKSQYAYIYSVKNDITGVIHYEVFKRVENTRFNCVSYPGKSSFGLWAWTTSNLDRAIEIFDNLNLIIYID